MPKKQKRKRRAPGTLALERVVWLEAKIEKLAGVINDLQRQMNRIRVDVRSLKAMERINPVTWSRE